MRGSPWTSTHVVRGVCPPKRSTQGPAAQSPAQGFPGDWGRATR